MQSAYARAHVRARDGYQWLDARHVRLGGGGLRAPRYTTRFTGPPTDDDWRRLGGATEVVGEVFLRVRWDDGDEQRVARTALTRPGGYCTIGNGSRGVIVTDDVAFFG